MTDSIITPLELKIPPPYTREIFNLFLKGAKANKKSLSSYIRVGTFFSKMGKTQIYIRQHLNRFSMKNKQEFTLTVNAFFMFFSNAFNSSLRIMQFL